MTSHPRSRPQLRAPLPDVDLVEQHTHPVSRLLAWSVAAAGALLLAGVLLLAAYAYSITARLSEVEAYIAEKGGQRDAERDQLDAQISAAVCDVLDRLPPAPDLDQVRADYGCGPGTVPEESR